MGKVERPKEWKEIQRSNRKAVLAWLRSNRRRTSDELLEQHDRAAEFVLELMRARKA